MQGVSSPAPAPQNEKAGDTRAQGEAMSTGDPAASEAAAEPLLRDYKGVTLGMSAKDAREKLGRPEEKGETMDFYVCSDKERARVYYQDGKVSAIIATYIGKEGGAPLPASVPGTDIEAKPDGSLYKMVTYPRAGYGSLGISPIPVQWNVRHPSRSFGPGVSDTTLLVERD